ncbi:MAG: hypothetical protein WCT16_02575 [Candidatus Buchananbacteria bacterium]
MATGVVVTGELYHWIDGKLFEIKQQIRQPNGYEFDPHELGEFLQRGIDGKFEGTTNLPYANERVPSSYNYPPKFRFRSPAEQLSFWQAQKLTKKLDGSQVADLVKRMSLAPGAEAIGVWPKFSRLGGLRPAAKKIFALLTDSRDFCNYRDDEIGWKECWRHTVKTAGCFQRLNEYQPGDYFVVPLQFGRRWSGASIRHARFRLSETEFGLCPYSGGCLLLTHPDRIIGDNQLYMDMAGCEWSPGAGDDLRYSAGFDSCDDRLEFDRNIVDSAHAYYGSVSAFAPQC